MFTITNDEKLRDESEGVVLPFGYSFELMSTGGSRQFDTNAIIERYDTKISQTVLADFIQLGHEKVGSFALSSDKTNLFAMAIGAYLDIICEEFNAHGIPGLIDINGEKFSGITDYPKMTHGDIQDVDLKELSTYIKDMVGVGVLIPDEALEEFVRQTGGLPKRTTDTVPAEARLLDGRRLNPEPEPPKTAAGQSDALEDDEAAIEAAKKRLGRVANAGKDSASR